jgi:DNA-binding XRE family transcriptional regulator
MVHLHTNLKLLRQWLESSQDDMAAALDVKRSSYSAYEIGASEPKLLVRMAAYLHVGLDELVRHYLSAWSKEGISDWQRRRNHARLFRTAQASS